LTQVPQDIRRGRAESSGYLLPSGVCRASIQRVDAGSREASSILLNTLIVTPRLPRSFAIAARVADTWHVDFGTVADDASCSHALFLVHDRLAKRVHAHPTGLTGNFRASLTSYCLAIQDTCPSVANLRAHNSYSIL
jgi:hypothetical protein